jgi:hypothetical protein
MTLWFIGQVRAPRQGRVIVLLALVLIVVLLPPPSVAQDDESPTPFRMSSLGRSGLTEERISDSEWMLRFRGNGSVTQQMLVHYFALRGAQIAHEYGYAALTIREFTPVHNRNYSISPGCFSAGGPATCRDGRYRGTLEVQASTLIVLFREESEQTVSARAAYEALAPLYLDDDFEALEWTAQSE